MTEALAFRMKLELQRLAKRHGTPPPTPHVEELLPDCDGPHLLSGYASAPVIDRERILFAKNSLTWQVPTLTYRHNKEIIGTVDHLEWRNQGLRVTVTTDHKQARCCPAYSIEATIKKFVLRDVDDPAGYHAEVQDAVLDSVTLTSVPACPQALVHERWPMTAQAEFWTLIGKRVELTRRTLDWLVQRTREQRP